MKTFVGVESLETYLLDMMMVLLAAASAPRSTDSHLSGKTGESGESGNTGPSTVEWATVGFLLGAWLSPLFDPDRWLWLVMDRE